MTLLKFIQETEMARKPLKVAKPYVYQKTLCKLKIAKGQLEAEKKQNLAIGWK